MKRAPVPPADPQEFGAALEAMSADELRAFVRDLANLLDEASRARLEATLLEAAARGTAGWRPRTPTRHLRAEVTSFVSAARRVGRASAEEVDAYLRQGTKAFLAGDFSTARAVWMP